MVPVAYVFAYFLAALALALLPAAVVAGGSGEAALIPDLLISAGLVAFLAGAIMLSLQGRERRLRPVQRYALAALLWSVLPAFAALPLLLFVDGVPALDAYFETVSALTTTGASALGDPGELPRTIVFWLSLLQWLGGALTILVIVLVLAPTGVGGLPEAHARLVEHGGLPERRRLLLVFQHIVPLYAGATVACFALLVFAGVEAFDALCLAFASISTGGFVPRGEELPAYVSSFGLAVLVLFMLFGATSVLWHRDLLVGRRSRTSGHREAKWIGIACVLIGLLAAARFHAIDGAGLPTALRDGLFTAVSLVTTTGIEVRELSFAVIPLTLLIPVVMIGGGTFSTAGGVKFYRMGAMLVQSGRELNRLVYPHAVPPARLGGHSYDIQTMKAIWSGFLAFVGSGLLVSWLVAADGVDYPGALLAAFAALSNSGPVYASFAESGDWLVYSEMSPATRLALCAAMVTGRLEVIAVFALLVYAYRRG